MVRQSELLHRRVSLQATEMFDVGRLDQYHFDPCAQNARDIVKINPSLMFSGVCGDAFRRYASLFGGEIVGMLTYAQSPLAESVPPDWRDKVWFARLRAGGLEITGGDPVFPDYEAP